MADVPYLSPGASITAEHWNDLFEEFDRKLSLALDDHSLLYLYLTLKTGSTPSPLYGKKFFFTSGTLFWVPRFFGTDSAYPEQAVQNYDHSVFTAAVSSMAVFDSNQVWTDCTPSHTYTAPSVIYDSARELVRLKFPAKTYFDGAGVLLPPTTGGYLARNDLLNYSLQAHRKDSFSVGSVTKENFYVLQGTTNGTDVAQWEREHLYDSVELILEGVTNVVFDANWDKYNFFRIHNLNAAVATVTFPNANVFTIPAYGSRCVRRDGDVYTEGYNHFHKFKAGDVRIFEGAAFPNPNSTALEPITSSNVFNQNMVTTIVNLLTSLAAPRFNIDPKKFCYATDVYAPGYFGDPTDGATKLGDLLFHKGKLVDVAITGSGGSGVTAKQEIDFQGFDSIVADFAAAGITVAYNGNGEMTLVSAGSETTRDLIGTSTNLIGDGGNLTPTAPALQIKPASPATNLGKFGCGIPLPTTDSSIVTTTVSWTGGSLDFDLEQLDYNIAQGGATIPGAALTFAHTVSDVEALSTGNTLTDVEFDGIQYSGFGVIVAGREITHLKYKPVPTAFSPTIFILVNGQLILSNTIHSISGATLTAEVVTRPYVMDYLGNLISPLSWPNWCNMYPFIATVDLYRNFFRTDPYYGTKGSAITAGPIFGFATTVDNYIPFSSTYSKTPAAESDYNTFTEISRKIGSALLCAFSYYGNKFLTVARWFNGESSTPFGTGNTSTAEWYRDNRSWFLKATATTAYTEPGGTAHLRKNVTDSGRATGDTRGVGSIYDYFPLMADTYNNLASLVNGIVSVVPIHGGVLFPELVSNTGSPFNFSAGACTVRPIDQFAKVTSGSAMHTALVAYGVTIKAKSDLPASFAALFTEMNRFKRWRKHFEFTVGSTTHNEVTPGYTEPAFPEGDPCPRPAYDSPDNTTVYRDVIKSLLSEGVEIETAVGDTLYAATFVFGEGTVNSTATGKLFNTDWSKMLFGTTATVTEPSTYLWVTVTSVKAFVESKGFDFVYQKIGLPLKLEIAEVDLDITNAAYATSLHIVSSHRISYQLCATNYYSRFGSYDICDWRITGAEEEEGEISGSAQLICVAMDTFEDSAGVAAAAAAEAGQSTTLDTSWSAWMPAKVAYFLPSETPDWIQDCDSLRVREDYAPAKKLGYTASVSNGYESKTHTITVVAPDDFYVRNWVASRYQTQPLHTADKNYEIILFRNVAFDDNASQVVYIPEPTLLWGPSAVTVAVTAIPATLESNGDLGTPVQMPMNTGDNFLVAQSICDRVLIVIDNRVGVDV